MLRKLTGCWSGHFLHASKELTDLCAKKGPLTVRELFSVQARPGNGNLGEPPSFQNPLPDCTTVIRSSIKKLAFGSGSDG